MLTHTTKVYSAGAEVSLVKNREPGASLIGAVEKLRQMYKIFTSDENGFWRTTQAMSRYKESYFGIWIITHSLYSVLAGSQAIVQIILKSVGSGML